MDEEKQKAGFTTLKRATGIRGTRHRESDGLSYGPLNSHDKI